MIVTTDPNTTRILALMTMAFLIFIYYEMARGDHD